MVDFAKREAVQLQAPPQGCENRAIWGLKRHSTNNYMFTISGGAGHRHFRYACAVDAYLLCIDRVDFGRGLRPLPNGTVGTPRPVNRHAPPAIDAFSACQAYA